MNKLQQYYSGGYPKLIMFDLDGTLVDSATDLAIAVNKTLETFSLPTVSTDDVRKWVGNGADMLMRRALTEGDDKKSVDPALFDNTLKTLLKIYPYKHDEKYLYHGIKAFLQEMKRQHVKMAIVTNKPTPFVAPLLEDLKIDSYFSWIVGGGSLPQKKPAPEPLLYVLNQANVLAEDALFIGDSRNDVIAAKTANVSCAALTYGYNHGHPIADENPTWVIDNVMELLAK